MQSTQVHGALFDIDETLVDLRTLFAADCCSRPSCKLADSFQARGPRRPATVAQLSG